MSHNEKPTGWNIWQKEEEIKKPPGDGRNEPMKVALTKLEWIIAHAALTVYNSRMPTDSMTRILDKLDRQIHPID